MVSPDLPDVAQTLPRPTPRRLYQKAPDPSSWLRGDSTALIMAPSIQTTQALEHLSTTGDLSGYEELLRNIKSLPAADITEDLNAYIVGVFESPLGLVHTRPLLDSFVQVLGSLTGPGSNDIKITIGEHAINAIEAQASSFEEQNGQIREIMATAYEVNEEYDAAAKILSGINVETSTRKFTNEELVRLWIRITRLLLEVDDTTSAETWLGKAKNLMYTIEDKELKLHFSLSQARIQDARRNFLVAAQGYLDISFNTVIAEEERLHTLSMAIKCAVLAGAGPARSRMLGRLYKDERSSGVEEYGILEKMFLDRIISTEEVSKFAEGLMPHQLAKTADGSTVLARAVTEHNLLAASRLYSNISFDSLGLLLGLSGEKAEETTARMIEQGRLVGRLDQIEQYIYFEDQEATGETGSKKSEGVVHKELRKYDGNIQGLAESVERVTSELQSQYPVSTVSPITRVRSPANEVITQNLATQKFTT